MVYPVLPLLDPHADRQHMLAIDPGQFKVFAGARREQAVDDDAVAAARRLTRDEPVPVPARDSAAGHNALRLDLSGVHLATGEGLIRLRKCRLSGGLYTSR